LPQPVFRLHATLDEEASRTPANGSKTSDHKNAAAILGGEILFFADSVGHYEEHFNTIEPRALHPPESNATDASDQQMDISRHEFSKLAGGGHPTQAALQLKGSSRWSSSSIFL
jgi:hypothetical protein